MPQGTLEVFLVSAKGLENTDFLCKFLFTHNIMKVPPFIISLIWSHRNL